MTFKDFVKNKLMTFTLRIGRKGDKLPKLTYFECEKAVDTSMKVFWFVFIIAEIFVLGWFFLKYLPNKQGWVYTQTLLLLGIYITLMFMLFKKPPKSL